MMLPEHCRVALLLSLIAGSSAGEAAQVVVDRTGVNRYVHGSSLVELASGDLLCSWFEGPFELHREVGLFVSRRSVGQSTWSPAVELFPTPDATEGNPTLFRDRRDRLWCVYASIPGGRTQITDNGPEWEDAACWARHTESHRAGGDPATWQWSAPQRISPELKIDGFDTGVMVSNKPVVLASGRIVLPMNVEVRSKGKLGPREWQSFYRISDDDGATWRSSNVITGPQGVIQGAVCETTDGLLALLRPRPASTVFRARSIDGGLTWTTPAVATTIPTPGARGDVVRLPSGRLLFIGSAGGTPLDRAWRNNLSAWRSDDQGATWTIHALIDSEHPQTTYAAAIVGADSRVHVSYSIGHRPLKWRDDLTTMIVVRTLAE